MAKVKTSQTATFKAKHKKKLGRHKKHKNKHESIKEYKGQGKH